MTDFKFQEGDRVVIDPHGDFYGIRDYVRQEGVIKELHVQFSHTMYLVSLPSGHTKFFWDSELSTPDEADRVELYSVTVVNQKTGEKLVKTNIPSGQVKNLIDHMSWEDLLDSTAEAVVE